MPRPREFEPSEALEKAMMAFWRHGYHGTGVQELVDSTGVNRASLYGTFGNKQRLFLAALARYTEVCVIRLGTSLQSRPGAVDGIRAMLDNFMADTLEVQRGCLLYNTALEVSSHDEEIRRQVEQGMERIESLLDGYIDSAQARGEIDPTESPLLLSRVLMSAMQSIAVRGSTGADMEVMESIRDGALRLFPSGGPPPA